MLRAPILIVAVALAAMHLAGTAHAQQDARERAKQLFQQGEEHLAAGRYDDAIQAYQAAYDLAPLAGFLYNLGQAWRLKGDRERAIAYYERYLTVEPKGKASAAAHSHIAELRKQIAEERRLAEEEARRKAEEQRRAAEEAQRAEEERQARERPEPLPAADPAPPDEPAGPPPSRAGRTLRLAGYSLVGAGGLLVGAGVVFGLRASSLSDELSEIPSDGNWTQERADKIAEGEAAERNMFISYGLGAAAITGGVLLIYYGRKAGREPTTALVPVLTPGGVALSFEGSF